MSKMSQVEKIRHILDDWPSSDTEWNEVFSLLYSAMESDDLDLIECAIGRAFAAIWAEQYQGDTDEQFKAQSALSRLRHILKIIEKQIERAPKIFDVVCFEGIHRGGHLIKPALLTWIDKIGGSSAFQPFIDKDSILSWQIGLDVFGDTWETAGRKLLGFLDHSNLIVRATAADKLAQFYNYNDPPLKLDEIMALILKKEIRRPGIAGPFWGAISFYIEHDLEKSGRSGDIDEWFFAILENRESEEPELEYFNTIDFHSHERFAGCAEHIQRLIDIGRIDIAIMAATENDQEIPEIRPVLVKLGYEADPEVVRLAAWGLAYHYRYIHPEGQRRSFVKRISRPSGVDFFLNYSTKNPDYPYSIVIYPHSKLPGFTSESAWRLADQLMPPSLRGKMESKYPANENESRVFKDRTGYHFHQGAHITFYGQPGKEIWHRIIIIWQGTPELWDPESRIPEEKN